MATPLPATPEAGVTVAPAEITPDPTFDLDNALTERVASCSPDIWRSFVQQAGVIQAQIESSLEHYFDANADERTLIEQKVNDSIGKLQGLSVDGCMSLVRDDLFTAYTQLHLGSVPKAPMSSEDRQTELYIRHDWLYEFTVGFEVLKKDLKAGMYYYDADLLMPLLYSDQPVPVEQAYLLQYHALDDRTECLQGQTYAAINSEADAIVRQRLPSYRPNFGPLDCSVYPEIANRREVQVVYKLEGPSGVNSVPALRLEISGGTMKEFNHPTLPFVYETTLMTGDRADLDYIPNANPLEGPPSITCTILIDGVPLASEPRPAWSTGCGAIIPE